MVKTIAISSGRGAVAKTALAGNSSISLSMVGKRVALLDADFGMANAHILLGQNPEKTVADFLRGDTDFEKIISKTQHDNLSFIAGGSALLELLNINNESRYEMIKSFFLTLKIFL